MIDTQERVWIGTKAGLFLADCSSEKKTAKSVTGFEGLNIFHIYLYFVVFDPGKKIKK